MKHNKYANSDGDQLKQEIKTGKWQVKSYNLTRQANNEKPVSTQCRSRQEREVHKIQKFSVSAKKKIREKQ